MTAHWLELQVHAIELDGQGTRVFDLRDPQNAPLPVFQAGSHVDVELADGLVRQYSLCNAPDDQDRYLIAVALAEPSRGGSAHLHAQVAVGDAIKIGAPRNLFALDPSAAHAVLIAGGIGITPIWAMAQALDAAGRSWQLHYGVRTCAQAPLLARIQTRLPCMQHGNLHVYTSREGPKARIDLARVCADAPPGSHFYCCGSNAMLDDFQQAMSGVVPERVHLEHFASSHEVSTDGGFEVVLNRLGRSLTVKPGQTILDALLEAGIKIEFSCREGICGECETRVIEGQPDHRDDVLSAGEHAANDTMMVCCSGSRGPRLVLDL